MADLEGYDPRDQHLYRNDNYNEGRYSYGSYERHDRGNFGGIDPNIVDYDDDDDYDEDQINGDYGLESIHYDHYDETETVHGREILLSILEAALEEHSRNDTSLTATPASTSFSTSRITTHREHLEQTWKAIRTHWLWAHDTLEEKGVGARCRNDQGLTPLHLICKLASNPPTDILEEIVKACPEASEWEDDHGWLPLHHACIHGASTEVLKLLTKVHPKSKIALDANQRTPLHLYATRGTSDLYNPKTLAINFGLLCSSDAGDDDESTYGPSPAEQKDMAGMLPMHYACAYGTTQSVLKVLEEAFPGSLEARDDNGRTPLHFVMVNAQRTASPGVLGYLLGHVKADDNDHDESPPPMPPRVVSVNVRDGEGNLPLHLLNLGLVGVDFDQHPEKLEQLSECLTLYLDAEPHVSTDFLAALQVLPDPLRDVGVVHPHVRRILNAKIIQRFPTSILMLDGIMLVIMIVCFELATTRFVDQVVGQVETAPLSSPLVMLYVTAGYFFLRELIQVIASLALGALNSWLYDTTNWLDVLVITLVTYYTTAMTLGDPQDYAAHAENNDFDDLGGFRTGTALTKGVLWTAVIFFLKSTQVDFAVFLNGVFYVVRRLVAFLLAILVILISFAQMFWLVYLEQPVCKFSCAEGDYQCEAEMEGCNYPHCEFGDSFLKVYTMMMGEIGTETRYDQNLVAQVLYIFYGFFIVILLSNVLIAIVTDSYEIVQNDRAAIVFWSNRLDFVAEMDSIASMVRKRLFCCTIREKPKPRIVQSDTQDDRSCESYHNSNASHSSLRNNKTIRHNYRFGSVEWFRDKWTSIISMFEHDVYASEDLRPIDFWYDVLNKTLAVLVIPPWLILGFMTVGILWPPQVREWLFVQKETSLSRAEIERRKLEQLQQIQRDTKSLKQELKMEMQHDRDEMFRMKAEVDAVQEEVLADLQQVNVLVTTLLTDLGGIPLEG